MYIVSPDNRIILFVAISFIIVYVHIYIIIYSFYVVSQISTCARVFWHFNKVISFHIAECYVS